VASRRPDDHSSGASPGKGDSGTPPGRLRGADALRLHLTLAVGLAICIGAFIIEVIRALDGNTLSWAYVFEWPIFAAFAIYMWWNLLHGQDGARRKPARSDADVRPDGVGPGGAGPDAPKDGNDPVDADLLAWREYLRKMEADEARTAGPDSTGSD